MIFFYRKIGIEKSEIIRNNYIGLPMELNEIIADFKAGLSIDEKLEKIKKTNNLPFPAIVADAFDVDALNKMCKDAEVVLSTAGQSLVSPSLLF